MLELPITLPRLTAIIGGGGKTTLLYALGRSLAAKGATVLLTTTTHLAWPPPEGVPFCSPAAAEELRAEAAPGQMLLAGYGAEGHRMTGLSPELLAAGTELFDYVICEADGSRGMPLKWHRPDEPCVPEGTGLLLQVAGLSALGCPAGEVVHRWEAAGLEREHRVSEIDMARLMLRAFDHSRGNVPAACILNQMDAVEAGRGEKTAHILTEAGYPCGICSLKKEQILCWY